MKQIKILGSGCAKCNQLYDAVKAVVEADGIQAELEKVQDIQQIVSYGVLTTPALVVDGQIRCAGMVPPADEIRQMLKDSPLRCCCGGSHDKGSCC